MNHKIPRFLAISDRRRLGRPLDRWLGELVAAGVDAVQLREKDLEDAPLLTLGREARQALGRSARLLVNGRVDIAVASGADGVHLPGRGLPIAPLRQHFGDRLLIGRSAHGPEDVLAARDEGADYVTFGPIFPTPSKPGWQSVPGLEGLTRAARIGLPLLALGGLDTLERAARALDHGASGIAAIRLFQDREALGDLGAALGSSR